MIPVSSLELSPFSPFCSDVKVAWSVEQGGQLEEAEKGSQAGAPLPMPPAHTGEADRTKVQGEASPLGICFLSSEKLT